MDPEHLRARLRRAADDLSDGPDDPRGAVAVRVRRHRATTSLAVLTAVLIVAVATPLLLSRGGADGAVEFADAGGETTAGADADGSGQGGGGDGGDETAVPCGPVEVPQQDAATLVKVYLPCGSTGAAGADTVAPVYRWVPGNDSADTIAAALACPTSDERAAGRVCLGGGAGAGLVTDVTVDGSEARVELGDADAAIDDLGTPEPLLAALRTTVFANYADVERLQVTLGSAAEAGDELCAVLGADDDCGVATRDEWAARPDGWRPAPLVEPPGRFGGGKATAPARIGDLAIEAGGFRSGEVRARDATTGDQVWTYTVDSPTDDAFVTVHADAGLVLATSTTGEVVALDAASGAVRWRHGLGAALSAGTPATADGVAYLPASHAAAGDDRPPVLVALDADTGAERWQAELQPATDLQWAPPTVAGDLVLIADTADQAEGATHLSAVDRASGEVVWTHAFDDRRQGFHRVQPLVVGDVVVAVDGTSLYGVDLATGERRWRRGVGGVATVFGVAPGGGVLAEFGGAVQTVDVKTGESSPTLP